MAPTFIATGGGGALLLTDVAASAESTVSSVVDLRVRAGSDLWKVFPISVKSCYRTTSQSSHLTSVGAPAAPGRLSSLRVLFSSSFIFSNSFLAVNSAWIQEDAVMHASESGLLTDEGIAMIKAGQGPSGSVRLTPRSAGTDGFFFAVLRRQG